jgi:hypothetical protein
MESSTVNTFVVQQNRFSEDELQKLTTAISKAGKTFRWLTNQDFDLPSARSKGGNLLDAYSTFAFLSVDKFLKYWNNRNYQSSYGNYFNYSFFNRAIMHNFLKSRHIACVNDDGAVTTSTELIKDWHNNDLMVFTTTPTKTAFVGGQRMSSQLIKYILTPGELQQSDFFVASYKPVINEARFIVINDKLVTQSMYRYNGKFITEDDNVVNYAVPPQAMFLAKTIVGTILKEKFQSSHQTEFSHISTYVLDLAQLEGENSWRFLEVNALPCSALYGCDYSKVIELL